MEISEKTIRLFGYTIGSYVPCGVCDDPGGGGARQTRVGGDGEAEDPVQLDLEAKREERL